MSQAAQNLNWLITNFVDNTPGVSHTVVVSADGLLLCMSEGFPRDRADQLAAVAQSPALTVRRIPSWYSKDLIARPEVASAASGPGVVRPSHHRPRRSPATRPATHRRTL